MDTEAGFCESQFLVGILYILPRMCLNDKMLQQTYSFSENKKINDNLQTPQSLAGLRVVTNII